MSDRARPPDDITPHEFFVEWVPRQVDADERRRARLGDTEALLVFVLEGDCGGEFTLEIVGGRANGRAGRVEPVDLEVRLDVETWRALNRGDLGAPEALLRRRLHVSGSFLLALKLHLILG